MRNKREQIGQSQDNVHISDGDRRRVAIVMYKYGLGNSPTLINSARLLAQNGYSVDIFTCGTFLGDISFDTPEIKIRDFTIQEQSLSNHSINDCFWNAVYRRLIALTRYLPLKMQTAIEQRLYEQRILAYAEKILESAGVTRYEFLIGIEPFGLMAACHVAAYRPVPIVYFNLELHYAPDVLTTIDAVNVNIEKNYIISACITITQDSNRAKLIAQQSGLDADSIVILPVCAEGKPFRERTDYLRKRFNLRDTDKIVLYAGFIADWAMCEEIAESVKAWPPNWVLVFHSHGYSQQSYMEQLKRYEGDRIKFSLNPVSYEQLPHLLSSADIGIALYKDLGANFTLIGSASGKIAHYLKCGIPVIVNSYPDISQTIEDYSCGVGVDSAGQIPEAITRITNNYEQMREGAFNCYEEKYTFSKYFGDVMERLNTYSA